MGNEENKHEKIFFNKLFKYYDNQQRQNGTLPLGKMEAETAAKIGKLFINIPDSPNASLFLTTNFSFLQNGLDKLDRKIDKELDELDKKLNKGLDELDKKLYRFITFTRFCIAIGIAILIALSGC